jgi:hypothetical protein
MISSILEGRSGLSLTGGTGARFRMDSKITPELSPRKGKVAVAISYKTTPNENKSVRASNFLARTCSDLRSRSRTSARRMLDTFVKN